MTFKVASDNNTGSADKFGAPDLNKITNMLNGNDINDTVTINANVFWRYVDSALKLFNTAKTYLVTIRTGTQTGNYDLAIPTLISNDTIITSGTAQTISGAKNLSSDLTLASTKRVLLSASTWILETSSNVFELFVNSVSKLNISNTLALFQNLDFAISTTKKLFFDGGGNTYALESSADNLDFYVGGTKALAISTTESVFGNDIVSKGGLTFRKISKVFEDRFTGKILDTVNFWTQNNVSGSNTYAMETGIDSGFKITTQASSGAHGSINFGTIFHFNPTNCTIFGIIQYDNANNQVYMGISSGTDPSSSSSHTCCVRMTTSTTFVELINSNGSNQTITATDVARSANNTPFKIICTNANIKLFLHVAGVWVLKATSSTTLPTTSCSPIFSVKNNSTSSTNGRAIFLRVENG